MNEKVTDWWDLDTMGPGGRNLDKEIKGLLKNKIPYEDEVIRRIIQTNNVKAVKLVSNLKGYEYSQNFNQIIKTAIELGNYEALEIILPRIKEFTGKYDLMYELNRHAIANLHHDKFRKTAEIALSNPKILEQAMQYSGWDSNNFKLFIKEFLEGVKLKKLGKYADLLD